MNAFVSLGLGAGFQELVVAGTHVIPATSWLEISLGNLPDPGPTGQAWFAQAVEFGSIRPLASSNLQELRLLR